MRLGYLTTMIGAAQARTLIVPKKHKNHRLSLSQNVPVLINSAMHSQTLGEDHFKIPDDYSFLSNDIGSVCELKGEKRIKVCSNQEDRNPWKIVDTIREVRFRNIDNKCVAVGDHNAKDDSYSIQLSPCDDRSMDQVFILNREHATNLKPTKTVEMTKAETYIAPEETPRGVKRKKVYAGKNTDSEQSFESEVNSLIKRKRNSYDTIMGKASGTQTVHGDGMGGFEE